MRKTQTSADVNDLYGIAHFPPDTEVPLTEQNMIEAANVECGGLRLCDYIKRVLKG